MRWLTGYDVSSTSHPAGAPMAHERPESLTFGRLVVEQRRRLSLSQTDVARRVRNAAKAEGRQSGATKQWVSEIERTGRIPHPDGLRWLAVAIEVPIERLVDTADQQIRARSERRDGQQLASERTLHGAARLLPSPIESQLPRMLAGGFFVPIKNGVANGVSSDAAAMNAFRAADRQVGGAHLYATVVHYLQSQVAPRLFGATTDSDGPLTFCAAAALTDMAGWMAHDADRNVLAQHHFQHALALAGIGEDSQLRTHILAGMSHLALHVGHPDEAMELAGIGTAKLQEGPANPELAARLMALEARAHAAQGDSAACARLLLQAEQTLDTVLPAERSTWISRFDEGSLAGEAARSLRQLGQLARARQQAERVLTLRPVDRARSRAFGQLVLARVLIEERDLDGASEVGRDVLDSTQALGSLLVVRQLQRLRDLLAVNRSAPPVAQFLEYLDEELRRRMVLYRSFSADEPG
jgi:transcriptional regulator with XRE-family HTH domain